MKLILPGGLGKCKIVIPPVSRSSILFTFVDCDLLLSTDIWLPNAMDDEVFAVDIGI